MRYLYREEKTVLNPARVSVSIPATRPRILGRALAALAAQTFQDFEVWVIYDKSMVVAEETAEIIRLLSVSHTVRELRGTGEGQVHAHNMVLWKTGSEYCLRLDDDVLLDRDALGRMVEYLDGHQEAAAAAGLWFNEGRRGRLGDVEGIENSRRVDNASAALQMNYHMSRNPVGAEHLYSVCLYRTGLMRVAGGWPVCYTPGLHHREETDGTHRLFKMGHKLVVLPTVTGIHLWSPGGVREDPDVANGYGEKRKVDDHRFFVDRLPRIPALLQPKKIVAYSEHTNHAAGGERHFYATLAAICEGTDFEVWGSDVGHGHFEAERVKEVFGFDTSKTVGFRRRWEWTREDGVDLAVFVSHAMVPWFPAGLFMGMVLFPMEQKYLDSFARLYGNSRYTAYHIEKSWGRKAGVIYPPPGSFEYKPDAKEKRILLVGWFGGQKGQWEAVQAFRRAGLPADWKLTLVGWPGDGPQNYFSALHKAVGTDPSVEIVGEVPQDKLQKLVESSRVVLGMRGISSSDPRWQEHFGLSVPEAMSAGAVPALFSSGGYLEIYPRYLFRNINELGMLLKMMAVWPEERWDAEAKMATARAKDFGYGRYRDETLAAVYELLRGGASNDVPYTVGEVPQDKDVVVVIPNYNHDEYLQDSVGSAMASTYRDFEIVVIDDGSPDNSSNADFYKSDKIRILRHDHAGPSIARNAGIAASGAKFVVALDADDRLLPDALRALREANNGEVMTYGDCTLIGRKEGLQQTSLPEYSFRNLLEKDFIPQTTMFPRWAWEQAGGYKELDGYEDWELWISLGEVGCAGKKVDAVTHIYHEVEDDAARHIKQGKISKDLREQIRHLHAGAYGDPQVGCCGQKAREHLPPWLGSGNPIVMNTQLSADSGPEEISVIYRGPDKAPFHVRGDKSRKQYKIRHGKPTVVLAVDGEFLLGLPGFERM